MSDYDVIKWCLEHAKRHLSKAGWLITKTKGNIESIEHMQGDIK
jgi:hypothetical protein